MFAGRVLGVLFMLWLQVAFTAAYYHLRPRALFSKRRTAGGGKLARLVERRLWGPPGAVAVTVFALLYTPYVFLVLRSYLDLGHWTLRYLAEIAISALIVALIAVLVWRKREEKRLGHGGGGEAAGPVILAD